MATQGMIEDLKTMLLDAIAAVQAASESGREATRRVEEQAHDPELKELLPQGSRHAEAWCGRLAQAAEQAGGGHAAPSGNPVIDAIQQVGGKIIHAARDPAARDLGVIAAGQLALHY